ncbi:Poly(A)+ RNA export protein [Mytilinidion resinicola]|uniref:Poly(A)+ RNA export protein n=1 Tax=Mytilinidion resinicola TaxID=574789 RepID=A0A6A6YKG2_9PEZI|nr:Poly(A)+ RNA export protein [Mytilinidion resinicola]KAF2809280.1 Poly(A)+ RNA export protein [Mytilinidion resinicola]
MSLFGQSNSAGTSTTNTQGDTKGDRPVVDPPSDSVSEIAFSSAADLLAVGSWDSQCRIYQVKPDGSTEGKHLIKAEKPVLGVCWSTNGTQVVAASADGWAQIADLNSGGQINPTRCAKHDEAIKSVRMFNSGGQDYLVTGGWDAKIKIWDLRAEQPILDFDLGGKKCYTMDIKNELLVVGTEDRAINMYSLRNTPSFHKTITSPLKWQTRVVSCFTDATGFAVGSIEGRCAIQYADDKDSGLNFSFKCHRQQDPTQRDVAKVYSVNAISFHPVHGTFSTAGSDGTFHFWDKDAKHRLKGYPEVGGSISSTAFNSTGSIFAYAVSYDWSKGYGFNNPNLQNKIMLHPVVGDECKPRPGSKKR